MTDRKHLTVADFLKHCGIDAEPALKRYGRRYGEMRLVVRRHQLSGGIGAQPTFDVVGLHDGFDWDDGSLFLELNHPVQAAADEYERERKMQRELSETIGFLYLALRRRSSTPEQKLREIVDVLRSRTGLKLKDVIPGEMPDVLDAVGKQVDADDK